MKSPITGKEMKLMREPHTLSFRKEEFEIQYHYYLCEDSGETFEDENLLQLNLTQVHNLYREKYNLPFTEEIIALREQYGLNASKMAAVLGFGTNVWRGYESGEIPNVSNGRLIQLIKDPDEFRKLLKISGVLSDGEMKKAEKALDNLAEQQAALQKHDAQSFFFGYPTPNRFTGFKMPNLAKFHQMVRYFVEHDSPWKVKLNKLLFYADFLHFRRTGFGISGAQYVAIQMGPIPKHFDGLFGEALSQGILDLEIMHFENGGTGELFRPGSQPFDKELFSPEELQTLEQVVQQFRKTNTKAIIELSHQEKGWKERIEGKRGVEYLYGWELVNV